MEVVHVNKMGKRAGSEGWRSPVNGWLRPGHMYSKPGYMERSWVFSCVLCTSVHHCHAQGMLPETVLNLPFCWGSIQQYGPPAEEDEDCVYQDVQEMLRVLWHGLLLAALS